MGGNFLNAKIQITGAGCFDSRYGMPDCHIPDKNKDRFKDLLNFALSSKKSNAIAGDQIEFIDTELLKKESRGRIHASSNELLKRGVCGN